MEHNEHYGLNDLDMDRGHAALNGGPRRTPTYDSVDQIPSQQNANNTELRATSATGGVNSKEGEVREVSAFDIAPAAPPTHTNNDAAAAVFGPLDMAVAREKVRIDELQNQFIEEQEQAQRDNELNEIDEIGSIPSEDNTEVDTYHEVADDRQKVYNVVSNDTEEVNIQRDEDTYNTVSEDEEEVHADNSVRLTKTFSDELSDIIGDDSDDDSDEDDDDEENLEAVLDEDAMDQKSLDGMKSAVKQIVTPIKKKLDLSKFTIAKEAASVSSILKGFDVTINTANWIFPNAKTCEVFTPLSATDIMMLDPDNHNKSRINTFRAIYKILYDHIVTPNKPDFEKWTRTTLFNDGEHLYYGMFLSTFGDSAFANPVCEKKSPENPKAKGCGYQFIANHKPMDYVKFADDKTKKKFDDIMSAEACTNKTYEVSLTQISDEFVFGLRMPSIYNVILETASLPESFIQKYSQTLEVFSYIEDIYHIDLATNSLVPVKYKEYPKDQPKNTASRIQAYSEIYNRITADQQSELLKNIRDIESSYEMGISYRIPECTCPECGNVVAERPVTPQNLLFTRHRLGRLASI